MRARNARYRAAVIAGTSERGAVRAVSAVGPLARERKRGTKPRANRCRAASPSRERRAASTRLHRPLRATTASPRGPVQPRQRGRVPEAPRDPGPRRVPLATGMVRFEVISSPRSTVVHLSRLSVAITDSHGSLPIGRLIYITLSVSKLLLDTLAF